MRVDRAVRTIANAAGRLCSTIIRDATHQPGLEELEARTVMSVVPHTGMFMMGTTTHAPVHAAAPVIVAAPSSFTAFAPSMAGVVLHWKDTDSSVTGFNILRSTDGKTFIVLARVSGGGATSFTDTTVAPNKVYWYEVQAVAGSRVSAAAAPVKVSTPLAAPTGLAAATSPDSIDLTWTDTNGVGVGYLVLRSTDGVNFQVVGTLIAGSTRKFTDSSISPGTTYYYRIEATSGAVASPQSASVTVAVPNPPSTLTVAPRYGNELVVTSTGADNISVSQAAQVLTIVANGHVFTQAVLAAGLFIYDRGGNDTITIDPSVKVHTTITTLGGGIDHIVSSAATGIVTAWLDTSDFFSGSGTVNWIGALFGNVSKAVGASLPNPVDSGSTRKLNATLFGTGPKADDVNQGSVGDCYFLATLAAFAGENPSVLTSAAVDMGDGTYLVRFMDDFGQAQYVRVSNDIPAGGFSGYRFAHPGASGSVWAAVMEKAFAEFRTGENSYASTSGGWMDEVYSDLGVSNANFSLRTTDGNFYSAVTSSLASGLALTLGTKANAPTMVQSHGYTLVGATIDSSGVPHYLVRNPWGAQGDALENSAGYASLTFAQLQANFLGGTRALA
jgi:hypothetical protein